MNRREFVARGALAAGSACLALRDVVGAAPPAAPWRLQLSTSTVQFASLSLEQACERIAQLGFSAVDIWGAYENCPHLDDAQQRLGPERLRALLDRHQLKLYAFSTYVGGYAKYAELLGQAGGGVAVQGSTRPCPPEELTAKMKAFLEGLRPLADLAEQHNSYLAIENHGQALLDSLDSFKAFTDLNRSPRLGIALAPYHLQARGASVEEAIRISGRQLLFFYAWQKQPGLSQLPGHGPTEFKPWLAALAAIPYRWYVNPFMHGHPEPEAMSAALRQARDYLRERVSR
ncbi:MAG: sugar phosphate isomerase/epimerase [Verrucomicrobia bacterium]|nr:sugar phosphate isomerase/epimerase [Verrucomicrobiota bacterium]